MREADMNPQLQGPGSDGSSSDEQRLGWLHEQAEQAIDAGDVDRLKAVLNKATAPERRDLARTLYAAMIIRTVGRSQEIPLQSIADLLKHEKVK